METKASAKDSLVMNTTFDLTKGENEKSLKFPKPFAKDVEVEVHGWVHGFRFSTEEKKDYQMDFWPSKVRNNGFTAHVESNAERVDVTWVICKKGKKKVASGSFSTEDAEGRKENAPEASGEVTFEGDASFDKAPTVLVAMSQFDLAGGRDLRLGVEVTDVTKDGFKWTISKSADTRACRESCWLTVCRNLGRQLERRVEKRRSDFHCARLCVDDATTSHIMCNTTVRNHHRKSFTLVPFRMATENCEF